MADSMIEQEIEQVERLHVHVNLKIDIGSASWPAFKEALHGLQVAAWSAYTKGDCTGNLKLSSRPQDNGQ